MSFEVQKWRKAPQTHLHRRVLIGFWSVLIINPSSALPIQNFLKKRCELWHDGRRGLSLVSFIEIDNADENMDGDELGEKVCDDIEGDALRCRRDGW